MTFKRYLLIFSVLLLSFSAIVVIINRIVDPFDYFADTTIEGFNAVKIKFAPHEREVKPVHLMRSQPASLIFGSSYAEIGFDPLHLALTEKGYSYNYGMAGSDWHRTYCNLKFALSHDSNLRQIVFGFVPSEMPSLDCSKEIKQMENPNKSAFLFSYEALEASIKTVLNQKGTMPSHTPEGRYFYNRGKANNFSRFKIMFRHIPACQIKTIRKNLPQHGVHIHKFDLSGIREIFQQAAERGIRVKMVVSPRHVLVVEREYQCGTRFLRWQQLKQLTALTKKIAPDHVEIWDFEGYNRVCTETVSAKAGHYWQDPWHYNFEFGNIMLDEAFAISEPLIGTRLTVKNIDNVSANEYRTRNAYIAEHPELLDQLKRIIDID